MALFVAVVLAVLVLPTPWNVAAVIVGGTWELASLLGSAWWSQPQRIEVGAETLIGREVQVRDACHPFGRVRVKGELWKARCDGGACAGDAVRVVGIDGLTLIAEPALPGAGSAAR